MLQLVSFAWADDLNLNLINNENVNNTTTNTTTINNSGIINNGTINIVFSDVQSSNWASEAIDAMSKRKVISGYEDGTFKPQNSISREEFAKMIAVTFSLDLTKTQSPTFTDVASDRWSFPFVESAKGFLTGYYPPHGKPFFDPASKVTREDVAVSLVKVLGLDSNLVVNPYFKDNDQISFNLRDYVNTAAANGLINGYEDGHGGTIFKPSDPVTRAEAATLLYRAIKNASPDPDSSKQTNIQTGTQDNPKVTKPSTNNNPLGLYADVVVAPVGRLHIVGGIDQKSYSGHMDLYVNGEKIKESFGIFFDFDKKIEKEGTYQFTLTADDHTGHKSTITKSIDVKVENPVITVFDIHGNPVQNDPLYAYGPEYKFGVKISDNFDSNPILYVNGQPRPIDPLNGSEIRFPINKGSNTFTFKAVNKYGKESNTVTASVYYN